MYKKLLIPAQIILFLVIIFYLVDIKNENPEALDEDTTLTVTEQNNATSSSSNGESFKMNNVRDDISSEKERDPDTYLVTKVIDGDTIEVEIDGERKRVRYIGVDTPETVHPSKPVQCFGKEALLFNKSLVEGKWVRLEKDISEVDKYGRLLRYVFVDLKFVNLELVKGGFANVVTYPPDVKYTELFLKLQKDAQTDKRGLWGEACSGEFENTPSIQVPPTSEQGSICSIKGNISRNQEKIYHVTGCEYYEKTIIRENDGERWFCSEEEALQAGWRKALNCPQS